MTIKPTGSGPFDSPQKDPKKYKKKTEKPIDITPHLRTSTDWETPSSKKLKKYQPLPVQTASLSSHENPNLTARQKKEIKQAQLALEAASLRAESPSLLKAKASISSDIEEIPAIREEKGVDEAKKNTLTNPEQLTAKQKKQLEKARLAQAAASLQEEVSSASIKPPGAQDDPELSTEWEVATRKKGASSLEAKASGLKIDPLEIPLNNLIEALDLPEQRKPLIYEALVYITQNKERWRLENRNQEILLLSGIIVAYNKDFDSITLTIDGNSVDFASLSISNPQNSGLSDEEFHQDHLFIIKNQVRLVQQAQINQARALQNKKIPSDIYYSTRAQISDTNPNLRLKRALMFTANNRVIMHLNKRALKKQIGEGGFKRLSLAIELATGKQFASASMPLLNSNQKKNFSKEVKFGKKFRGRPHFVQMHDVVTYRAHKKNTPKARILYEYLQGNDLLDVLGLPGDKQPTKEERHSIIKQLATIICDLHRESIALKDLKLDNVFITRDEHGAIKVIMIDFGLFQNIDQEDDSLSGSLVYVAPEYRRLIPTLHQTVRPQYQLGEFDRRKGDVWALGLLFCILLKNEDPWKREVYTAFSRHQDSPEGEFPPISSPLPGNSLNSLIHSMLHPDPNQRVPMETVDRFFNPERYNSTL